ncbi:MULTISPECIES: FUSC family protein [Pseudomonas syringae group]|uniref:FUSC family protein n=1 Tax=Pseudomonas serbiensis TaxID=3064350 RepID=A0ABT9CVZ8_9PSED|nr:MULTISPECIES: FUSC family protein [Pseudomonas]MDO7929359.1 FUSC family protein [Pseudomonas sp. KFB-138]
MTNSRSVFIPSWLRPVLRPVLDPYRRYRHARLIHAARIVVGLLVSILLTSGLNMPHGEWASVTMLIVIGGLQHHGNIGKKSVERAYGTLIGAGLGLFVVVQQGYLEIPLLTYVMMSVMCGFFAYHAIGKGGYTALLSAITLFIVAGHGVNPISDGLWRTLDIMIGIALALAFSFALPLYAVFSWRYNLASGLRDCAKVYGRIHQGEPISADEHLKLTARLNATMLQLRSLLPSVSKEVKISMVELDAIQGHFRMCLSTLEILSNIRPANLDQAAGAALKTSMDADYRQIRRQLIGMARALQTGATERLARQSETAATESAIPAELTGYHLMTQQLAHNLDRLQERLSKTAKRWKF